jgi:hypothetical protein
MEGALLLLRWIFGYVIHAVTVPLWISYKFIDILWLALLFAIVFSVIVFLIQNKIYAKRYLSKFAVCFFVFSVTYFFGSKVCVESYIQSIAGNKYNKEEAFINVDYGKIFYYPMFRYDYIGSAHAHICIENNKYNWSFRERDFYNANTTYSCEK